MGCFFVETLVQDNVLPSYMEDQIGLCRNALRRHKGMTGVRWPGLYAGAKREPV